MSDALKLAVDKLDLRDGDVLVVHVGIADTADLDLLQGLLEGLPLDGTPCLILTDEASATPMRLPVHDSVTL